LFYIDLIIHIYRIAKHCTTPVCTKDITITKDYKDFTKDIPHTREREREYTAR